ncbi:hypothetical protein Q4574_02355 [Aliiglaciecola sp. 3_MG-2023]|uniref:DUF6868 family protein n=1 Tax=Alteromonadaceae TaxID=72275 RepID=UPI001C0A5106|nr:MULTISPECIES: hypothetical protein [Aliiglaciecola]MBU2878579.1 hypothetical protein [Aliiglaciecola lipolytica]MDO6692104.1 hypothetical protein [Aliiglaciecola sp. 3_MG-2023]MDO6709592.1 hypothetical protein [Aliiglaciecola sp. 2_MG-2023]MDO6750866.1 hypothetical protein [Aliiglaciecola sp. 1_MG-2023]
MTIIQITELFGWASIINLAYLLLATLIVTLMPDAIASIHSKVFKVEKSTLPPLYINFLSLYKVMTLVFIVSPYIALKIMGS